ncbi:MAG: class I SAM-dependent methyltransferase, partial [Gallionellaceae bacterium]|nr:class I SAM-dependent methyltransferase [Gallionellaceae bacterium]
MFNRLQQLPPPVLALLLQAISVLTTVGIAFIARAEGFAISFVALVFLCGVLAAALSHLFGLARWWIPIQLLFLPALTWALSFHLSSHWFLAAFL